MNIVQIPRRFVRDMWGGTETVILETSKRLATLNYRNRILCPDALASNPGEFIDGVEVRRYPAFYPYLGLRQRERDQLDRKGGNLFSFQLLGALLAEPSLDMIHLHTGKRIGGIGRYVARRRKLPYVVSLHGGVFDVPQSEVAAMTHPTKGKLEWGKALGWWVGSRRVLQDADAIICVGSEEHRQVARRFPNKRVVHLPNGVDAAKFAAGDGAAFRAEHHIPADRKVLLTVGRIDPQKNQLRAVQVFADLLRVEPRAHLLFVGAVTDPSYRLQIEQAVRAASLESRVTLIPGLEAGSSALVDAYHAANMFWLPSAHEPFGIVLLEAWAAGLPVVGAPVGGIPDLIEHGVDGLLADPHDQLHTVRAILSVLHDDGIGKRMGEAGGRKARSNYSWDHITARLADLYLELVTTRRQSHAM